MERIHEEWRAVIVRGDDGVFYACFDPGSEYRGTRLMCNILSEYLCALTLFCADWLKKWLHPSHYSHGGRLNRKFIPLDTETNLKICTLMMISYKILKYNVKKATTTLLNNLQLLVNL